MTGICVNWLHKFNALNASRIPLSTLNMFKLQKRLPSRKLKWQALHWKWFCPRQQGLTSVFELFDSLARKVPDNFSIYTDFGTRLRRRIQYVSTWKLFNDYVIAICGVYAIALYLKEMVLPEKSWHVCLNMHVWGIFVFWHCISFLASVEVCFICMCIDLVAMLAQ